MRRLLLVPQHKPVLTNRQHYTVDTPDSLTAEALLAVDKVKIPATRMRPVGQRMRPVGKTTPVGTAGVFIFLVILP